MLASPGHLVVGSTSALSLPELAAQVPDFSREWKTHTPSLLWQPASILFQAAAMRCVRYVDIQLRVRKPVAPTLYSKPSTDFSHLLWIYLSTFCGPLSRWLLRDTPLTSTQLHKSYLTKLTVTNYLALQPSRYYILLVGAWIRAHVKGTTHTRNGNLSWPLAQSRALIWGNRIAPYRGYKSLPSRAKTLRKVLSSHQY